MIYGKKIEESKIQPKPKPRVSEPLPEEITLIDNYGEIIKKAREKKNLTRKEFAQKIKEKESVIKRVEAQEMIPDDKLLKKIENFLEISLKEKYQEKPVKRKMKTQELTIGDIIEVENEK